MGKTCDWLIIIGCTLLLVYRSGTAAQVDATQTLNERILNFVRSLDGQGRYILPLDRDLKNSFLAAKNIRIENCGNYPYHNQYDKRQGFAKLADDLKKGLKIGLQCLTGEGQMGPLHPYHQRQASLLLSLLESDKMKTFRCVEDEMFAYAVANTPAREINPGRYENVIQNIPFPAVVIDIYRISGFISTHHDPSVYRDFFKLDDRQIEQYLSGNPQRLEGMHQVKDRAGLIFHEMVHWLGHDHTNIYPDVVFLYETCCFGGSDFISDHTINHNFQRQACNILKDEELWEANQYKQMRLWRYKGYDQLKRDMREYYD